MRVLVTGHLGYIGAVLTPMLASNGFEVRGLDSDLFRQCDFGAPPAPVPSLRKDLRDVELEDLRGLDAVVHLAAIANDSLGDVRPDLTMEVNWVGTVRLAELCKKAGVKRFVFSSSCSVYGAAGPEPVTEQSPLRPVTPYAESKARAEAALREMADDNFCPVILRNATVYGPSPRLRCDLVLNDLVGLAVTEGRVALTSDGTPWRPVVHIEDVCRAFLAALRAPAEQVWNETFNVGRSDENFQVRELAHIVCQAVPGSRVEVGAGASADRRSYRVNCDKFPRTVPQWRACWTARAGARQLCDAYGAAGLTSSEFRGPKYRRLSRIRALLEQGLIGPDLREASPTAAGAAP